MKRLMRLLAFIFLTVAAAACAASPIRIDGNQPSADQVETAAATTLQTLAPGVTDAPATQPVVQADLLPQTLYFLANDNQGIIQIYRLERDGRTKTQLTSEPVRVWDYDVSRADGSLAFETNGQLILVNADGSNRRVLVEGTPDPEVLVSYHPTFSPDGQTLAYAHGGLNLYSIPAGASSLVIEDKMEDVGNGLMLPIETYSPERYSPDGAKLLLALGHWEVAPSHAVYDPATNALVEHAEVTDYIFCCSFHGGPNWSADSSSFYGVASAHDSAYKFGQLWRVNAADGAITRMLGASGDLAKEPYLAPDGNLYFFFGSYKPELGYFDAPVLQLVRSAAEAATTRTLLRDENFVMMNEALWAPDASFVVVVTSVGRDWDQDGGVLELYYTDAQKGKVWLAPFGQQLKWGP